MAGLRIMSLQYTRDQLLLAELLSANPVPSTSFSFATIHIRARVVGPTPFLPGDLPEPLTSTS